jgi:hypothetical protein
MAWLVLGLIHAMIFGWASSYNLAWLKLETIPMALDKQTNDALWGWVKQWARFAVRACQLIDKIRNVFPSSFLNYFGERHIIYRLARLKYPK